MSQSIPSAASDFRVTRFFLCGVGGLGTLFTAHLLAKSCLETDLEVVASEVHGMSQRGGSVQTSVIVGGAKSPLIAEGNADVYVGLEPLEALRYRSMVGPQTSVVYNTESVVPVSVTMGGPAYPALDDIEATLAARAGRVVPVDATSIAAGLGLERAANVVLLGALSGLDLLPCGDDAVFATMAAALPERHLEANRRAFEAGQDISRIHRGSSDA